MTGIIEPHGPQGATIQTADRRPWKAPRLVDLDEDGAASCWINTPNGMNKNSGDAETSSVANCYFTGNDPRFRTH